MKSLSNIDGFIACKSYSHSHIALPMANHPNDGLQYEQKPGVSLSGGAAPERNPVQLGGTGKLHMGRHIVMLPESKAVNMEAEHEI